MNISMPENVKCIIKTLETAGFEAYAVGGCIRDSYMGRIPNDWDITTSARPDEVKKCFARTVDTGIEHGTVTVLIENEGYEVTTYRIDGEYEDARHPKEVEFTDSLLEDLRRRDFTINALAYNDSRGLVDAFDGIGDMQRGIIRCVGDAKERFSEDALRMMRAVRFSAQLGFEIEEETKSAIKEMAPNLGKVSAERIMTELTKLLVSDHPERIRVAYECGLTAQFIPEFDICMECEQNNPHHCYSVGEHIIHTLINIEPDRILRFAMLLHDIAKPQCKTIDEYGITHNKGHASKGVEMGREICHRLKSDNELIDTVSMLIKYHDWRFEATPGGVRKAVSTVGKERFALLLKVQEADMLGQSEYQRDEKRNRLNRIQELYEEILEAQDALCIKDLAIDGRDLIEAGIKAGPKLGEVLQFLLEHVLDTPEDNKRDVLLSMVESNFKN